MDIEGFKRILVNIGEMNTPKNIRDEYSKMGEPGISAMEYKGYQVLRQKAFERCVMRRMEKFYDAQIDKGAFDEIMPIFKEIRKDEEETDNIRKSQWYMLTFCPQDLYLDPFEFMKLIERIRKFKWVIHSFYVIEQRFNGEPNDKYKKEGDGIHIHMLMDKGDYKHSAVKRDVQRVFRDYAEYRINIDYRMIREAHLGNYKSYMLGDKKDPSKQIKQQQDKIWRDKVGLREYYGEVWF